MMIANTRVKLFWISGALLLSYCFVGPGKSHAAAPVRAGSGHALASSLGGSATLLPNGDLLLIGGQGGDGTFTKTAAIKNAQTGLITPLPAALNFGRAWHTATVLPDGTVLILGGIGSDGRVVDQSEVFDPRSQKFQLLSSSAPIPRAFHSATLLTDGRVLVAGGVSTDGAP